MSSIDPSQFNSIQLIPICSPFGTEQAPAEFYIDDFILRLPNSQIADHLSRQRNLPVSLSRVSRKRSRSVFESQQ